MKFLSLCLLMLTILGCATNGQNVTCRVGVQQSLIEDRIEQVLGGSPARISILALSAGGEWGAFGAGFLKGWSSTERFADHRLTYEIVTGVSAGALLATYAFLGKEFDDHLEYFRSVRDDDVFRKRLFPLYFFSSSMNDTSRLREYLRHRLSEKLPGSNETILDKVEQAGRNNRLLLVGAVNTKSGLFESFDLTKIATMKDPERTECYAAALMASSAIPGVFSPVLINDDMYVDGGARAHVFIARISDLIAMKRIPRQQRIMRIIVNGDLAPDREQPKRRLVPIALRAVELMTDQVLYDSVDRLLDERHVSRAARSSSTGNATPMTWDTRFVYAKNVPQQCQLIDSNRRKGVLFFPEFESCLFDYGLKLGKGSENPWETELPSRPPLATPSLQE